MNNTFSWKRFCQVVAKDFSNFWYLYGKSFIIIALLPVMIWTFNVVIIKDSVMTPESRQFLIFFQVLTAGIHCPSRMFGTCNLGKEGVYFAMLPATKGEKFASMVLFTFLVFPIAMWIGTTLIDILLTLMPFGPYRSFLWESTYIQIISINGQAIEGSAIESLANVLFTLTTLAKWFAIFLFTNTLFKKHKVSSTILWLILILFVGSLVVIPTITMGMERMLENETFYKWMIWIYLGFNVIITAVLLWWSARRLKKMSY